MTHDGYLWERRRVKKTRLKTGSIRRNRRNAALAEAAKALNGNGIAQATLTGIAERLGVTRAALYYYFEDQEDLVFQCYKRSCELMAECLVAARATSDDALETIATFINNLLGEGAPEFAALAETASLRAEQRGAVRSLYSNIMLDISAVLEEGMRRGELRSCEAPIVAQAILGLASWFAMAKGWRANNLISDRELLEGMMSIFNWGIALERDADVDYRTLDLTRKQVRVGQVFDTQALAAAKQEALLAAASWLFNVKGIVATSLDEIALRVGVTKKVIYHNLGDKDTLVAACYRRSFAFYEDIAQQMAEYDGSRIDAFCASTHAFAHASLREDIAPLSPTGGIETLPYGVRPEIRAASDRLIAAYSTLIARGRAEGTIRDISSDAVLVTLSGLFEWLPKWSEMLGPAQWEAVPRELALLIRVGLKPLDGARSGT